MAEVPAKIEESEKLEMAPEVEKPVLTPQPELAVEKPEESEDPEVKDTSPEAEQEINQPVPVELATGPEGTSKEFIITLVDYLTEGREGEYRNFLIRPSEMAIEVDERDFNRGVDLWLQQFNNIHESLGEAENVTIRQIILQRARTNEIERATLDALRKRISGVNKVFTYVKVNLLIDGEPAYISIGGLMQTDNGWRIGGRISFTQQLSLQ